MNRHWKEIGFGFLIAGSLALIGILVFLLVSCDVPEKKEEFKRFAVIQDDIKIDGCTYDIVHDRVTNIIYLQYNSGDMCPLYNSERVPCSYDEYQSDLKKGGLEE